MGNELFESVHGVAGPTKAKVAADLGRQTFEPVSLAGTGTGSSPPALLETMGEAVADIGNRGLKAAPIIDWASGDDQPAGGTAITAHKDWMGRIVEEPGGKSVSPDAPATAWTARRFGPGKISTELNDALDGGFGEK